jgi:4-amino-4-deoxy-L-arabinose transferase-like glycosyltransferase
MAGLRIHHQPDLWDEGLALLYDGDRYDRNLTLARLGVLPFLWVAVLVVYVWGKRYLGDPGATLAVLLYTMLPPVLAHAGLATTDMALTAMVSASLLTALIWLEQPIPRNSVVFGAVTGLAVLTKFSALPFLPSALGAALLWHIASDRPGFGELVQAARERIEQFCFASVIAMLVVWAGYRFSFGSVPFTSIRLPAPELYAGIQQVIDHNRQGDPSYLLGDHGRSGWWYYYFVVLAVKTPLPFIALFTYGVAQATRREARIALALSLGILVFCLSSHINLGVRHILPVYTGFAVVAAAGVARLRERSQERRSAGWVLAGLTIWMVATSVMSHPDYLPYFNALAGDSPERILVDSDLDWGQDMKRLANRLREVGAPQVSFTPLVHADLDAQGFPPSQPNNPIRPSAGWNAISLTILKNARFGLWGDHPEIHLWPDQIKPAERIGKGIWLWYFPPASPNSLH